MKELRDELLAIVRRLEEAHAAHHERRLSFDKESIDSYVEGMQAAVDLHKMFSDSKSDALSILEVAGQGSEFEREIKRGIKALKVADDSDFADEYDACSKLLEFARQLERHLRRSEQLKVVRPASGRTSSARVFIGHGQSPAWREVKELLSERLGLPIEEFNRVSAAGISTKDRLSEMLDASSMAFLIFTAEDDHADGRTHARLNVVHEAGLFQGRHGFNRAIILLEEGCGKFSNLDGLTYIGFSKGKISAAFEEIRRVLEREGLVSAARTTA